ncbi:ABC transporter ATP-binding protein [Nocardia sp. NPDC046473]|uniref:ABC transporter ATP-binding protein n=1 Tax=Nocardia sp. NPDC046473 TaxID=3155733 RepID=UPI0033D98484
MRPLPIADPGDPDIRSAGHYLVWLTIRTLGPLLGAALFGILWMGSQALVPAVIREAIDDGLVAGDLRWILVWSAVLLGLGVVYASSGTIRRRLSQYCSLATGYRTVQLVVRHANLLGAGLERRVATGEIISVGTMDLVAIGKAFDIVGRAIGAVVSVVLVAAVLLRQSTSLGLLVIIALPAIVVAMGLTLRPLQRRETVYRDLRVGLASKLTDFVAGLRVLRGIGGENTFARSYRERSQQVRAAGMEVAHTEASVRAVGVLLPGLLVGAVTWIGAVAALRGAVTAGELVSFYAYAAFLIEPLSTFTESADRFVRAHVAARRAVTILGMRPEFARAELGVDLCDGVHPLVDDCSGLVVGAGEYLAVVASPEDGSRLADRLGGYTDAPVTYAGLPLDALGSDALRRRILVVDNHARLFRGTLRGTLGGHRRPTDEVLAAALRVAAAEDIAAMLPAGLDTEIATDGRQFSGGQRQRLILARSLLAEPEVLILMDPTSAVDAYTEAIIARRLRAARAGRTTVVVGSSSMLLAQADRVAFLVDGRVIAHGPHRELLAGRADYRAAIETDDVAAIAARPSSGR